MFNSASKRKKCPVPVLLRLSSCSERTLRGEQLAESPVLGSRSALINRAFFLPWSRAPERSSPQIGPTHDAGVYCDGE